MTCISQLVFETLHPTYLARYRYSHASTTRAFSDAQGCYSEFGRIRAHPNSAEFGAERVGTRAPDRIPQNAQRRKILVVRGNVVKETRVVLYNYCTIISPRSRRAAECVWVDANSHPSLCAPMAASITSFSVSSLPSSHERILRPEFGSDFGISRIRPNSVPKELGPRRNSTPADASRFDMSRTAKQDARS